MTRRILFAAVLTLLSSGTGAVRAGIFSGPYDFSLGPWNGAPGYSYPVAYGYQLPYGTYQMYNPFDPYQNPGHGAYYPRESFYALPPYGMERYYGPRVFHGFASTYPAPGVPVSSLPVLLPVPAGAEYPGVIVEVNVPADAEVWFDGAKTTQAGTSRIFNSPPLPVGNSYLYLVRAKWNEGGQEREQMQTVSVRAGERVRVTFPLIR